MMLIEALQAAGAHGRVRSPSFSENAIGISELEGKSMLFWFDEGRPLALLSARATRRFLTDKADDWRPAN